MASRRTRLLAPSCLALLSTLSCSSTPPAQPPPTPAPSATTSATAPPAPPARTCHSEPASAPCIEPDKLLAHLHKVAKPRPPGSSQHQAVRDYCATHLAGLGYRVEHQRYGSGTNIIGSKPGRDHKNEQVILSAHYDHVPYCSGADDNASGVAVVLEAAAALAHGNHARSLVVACWDEEEAGLIGSRAYAKRARQRGDTIIMAIALDGVAMTDDRPGAQRAPDGFERIFADQHAQLEAWQWRGHFITAVGEPSSRRVLDMLQHDADHVDLPLLALPLNLLQKLLLQDAARSDHSSFWLAGYPAILLTDTAEFRNPSYHCMRGDDSIDTLDTAFLTKVARTTLATTHRLLNPPHAAATAPAD